MDERRNGTAKKGFNSGCFKHCPKCGAEGLTAGKEKINHYTCGECGFEFFHNIAAAVMGIIKDEQGRLVVIARKNEPAKGKWDLPGGFADADESAEEALGREIKEELGLEVIKTEYFMSAPNDYHYKGVHYKTVDLAYNCEVEDFSKVKVNDEIESVVFAAVEEIDIEKFGFESTRKIMKCYLEQMRQV